VPTKAYRSVESPFGCLADEYLREGRSFEPIADGCSPLPITQAPVGIVPGSRNTALYNAHSYHTKVPPEAITPFIEHFTRPGDVVLDPFSGTGMTGVAAALVGRRAIVNDLSLIGTHLAFNHTRACDPDSLREEFERLYASLLPSFREWYSTDDAEGNKGYIHYTLWSKVYVCRACKHRFSMWSITDTETGRVGRLLRCPACGYEASRQSWRPDGNEPVRVNYELGGSGKRHERDVSKSDLAHIATFSREGVGAWYPKFGIGAEREMFIRSALHLQGVQTIADFYTPRNLLALSSLWEGIQKVVNLRVRYALAFAFTNTAWHGTRMRRFNARGGQRPLTGTLYIPQLSSEVNVLEVMKNKVAQLASYYRSFQPVADCPPPLILMGSATNLDGIPDASVDYVFTDPPFGSNIFYADCNLIWESWLGGVTDDTLEAVVNRSRTMTTGGKTVADYGRLMAGALREIHRVLKPSGWVTLVFHNTDADVWKALQDAAADAGFRVDGAAGLDRAQQSHKGYKGRSGEEDVAHFDVVLSMQKVVATHRRADARPVTDAILKERLGALSEADERVASSLQWAHSMLIRDLLVANYDLSDVSFERVRGAWAEGRALQPSRRRTPKRPPPPGEQDLPTK
jgi:DNA-directed RNA polymerase subunit RPC12/RpoP/16S rRNA G966 N2-methylase RsmD